jgi:hypothetical protein
MRARRATRTRARVLVAGTLVATAFAACGSGEPESDAGAAQPAGEVGRPMTAIVPAQIDARPHAFVSLDVLRPVTNAWRAGSRERLTEVNAGALPSDRGTGAFAIFRHDFLTATQEVTVVEVRGAGPVRIIKAPTGARVVERAQRDGEISFAGARGVRGTLDLSDDTISRGVGDQP